MSLHFLQVEWIPELDTIFLLNMRTTDGTVVSIEMHGAEEYLFSAL